MMKKKYYIAPTIKVFTLQTTRMLMVSGDELPLPWSGDHSGTAGPGEIDDNSTIDTFSRMDDFVDFVDFDDF